jgi:predicted RNA polymerase sigma factor
VHQIVDALPMDDDQFLHSTRADLLRCLGSTDEARAVYERARSSSACDQLERRFLERRLEAL